MAERKSTKRQTALSTKHTHKNKLVILYSNEYRNNLHIKRKRGTRRCCYKSNGPLYTGSNYIRQCVNEQNKAALYRP